MNRRALMILTSLFVSAGPGVAQEDLRHAAVFQERVDGEVQASSAAEDAFMEAMLGAGAVFVDEEQSRKIRSVTDAGELIKGDIAPVVMSLDTDLLIVGVCQAELVAKEVMGRPLIRYSADLRARVISVDSGEVVAAFTVEGEGMKFTAPQAARAAAQDAAKKLAGKVAVAVKERRGTPTRIEILVEGTRNITETDRVRTALEGLEGVTAVRVLKSGRPLSKLSLRITTSAREIAMALQATPGAGVEVFGYSEGMVKAEYSASAALDLGLRVDRFEGVDAHRKDHWMADGLPRILEADLANCPFLSPSGAAMARNPDRSLVLSGSYAREGKGIRIEAQLAAASTGRVAVSAQEICATDEVSACGLRLAAKLRGPLLETLRKDRKLFQVPLGDPAALASAAAARKPLSVESVTVDELFPTRAEAYVKRSVGEVSVVNRSGETLEDLVVTATLTGGLAAPLDLRHGALGPGAAATIPLKLALDRAALADLDESRTLVLSLRLAYRAGELHVEQTATHPVLVHTRNTVRWAAPNTTAAFVTPAAEGVVALVSRSMPTDRVAASDPLQIPVLLYQGLGAAGVRYLADAASPAGAGLDTIRFPDETLAGGMGDCDDLSVLYASLLEAAGRPAALLLVPGHVLVAFDTGIPAQGMGMVTLDPARVLLHRGTVWIPVEATKTDASFPEAWDLGAHAVRDAGDRLTVVRIRKGWRRYPPTDLSQTRPTLGAGAPADSGEALAALDTRRRAEVEAALADLSRTLEAAPSDGAAWRRRGVLLAGEGRLDEAREALQRSAEANGGPDALADLANLDALAGEHERALSGYRRALEETPKSVPIRLNLGVLLYLSGDKKAAMKIFMGCISDGAEEEVGLLGRTGCGLGGAGTRGDAAGAGTLRGLTSLVRETFEASSRPAPVELDEEADTKAGAAGATSMSLRHILHWL